MVAAVAVVTRTRRAVAVPVVAPVAVPAVTARARAIAVIAGWRRAVIAAACTITVAVAVAISVAVVRAIALPVGAEDDHAIVDARAVRRRRGLARDEHALCLGGVWRSGRRRRPKNGILRQRGGSAILRPACRRGQIDLDVEQSAVDRRARWAEKRRKQWLFRVASAAELQWQGRLRNGAGQPRRATHRVDPRRDFRKSGRSGERRPGKQGGDRARAQQHCPAIGAALWPILCRMPHSAPSAPTGDAQSALYAEG